MSKQRLLVHIGVPKSATTSLQFGAFPSHPGIRYLGKPFYDEQFGYEGSLATAELSNSLWKQDELAFDYALARQRFEIGIRPRLNDNWLAVLSEEGLSQASAADRLLTARRLKEICNDIDCAILMTVREQKSALFSGHQWNYARRLTSLGIDNWIRYCRSYNSYYGCYNDYPLRQYRYARLVETYSEIFGRERIMVLPIEMLAKEPRRFFSRLEDFAGVGRYWSAAGAPRFPVMNRSPGRLGIMYQRTVKGMRHFCTRLRGESVLPSEALEETGINGTLMHLIEHIDFAMPPMSAETAAWLDDYYRADNAAMKGITGMDLQGYGYVC
jgi:hypothetical protein